MSHFTQTDPTMPEIVGQPAAPDLEAIARDASDYVHIAAIVDVLLFRDGCPLRRDQLPNEVLKRYEQCAALAVRGSVREQYWPAIYYALAQWIGDLEAKELPVERIDLAKAVDRIVEGWQSAILGNIPTEARAQIERLVANDLGRNPDAFLATLKGQRI